MASIAEGQINHFTHLLGVVILAQMKAMTTPPARRVGASLLAWAACAGCADSEGRAGVAPPTPDPAASSSGGARAPGVRVEVIERFDAGAREHPEAVAVDAGGRVFVTLHGAAAVYVRDVDGRAERVPLPGAPPDGTTRVNGVALLGPAPFFAVRSADAELAGVWQLAAQALRRVAALPARARLNGMAAEPARNRLFVTDDGGRIFAVDPIAGAAEVWAQGPLFEPTAEGEGFEAAYGANGIAVDSGAVYVSVPARRELWRLPILPDGSAGAPESFLAGAGLGALDDFDLDERGGRFVGANISDEQVILVPLGAAAKLVLATAEDGLAQPTAAAFAPGHSSTVYVTNGAFWSAGGVLRPSLMKVTLARAPGP